jgi:hypothetical protein
MVTLGVESRRKRQNLGWTELDAESARFAALDYDGNSSFGHETPTSGAVAAPEFISDYAFAGSQLGVTMITERGEVRHKGYGP